MSSLTEQQKQEVTQLFIDREKGLPFAGRLIDFIERLNLHRNFGSPAWEFILTIDKLVAWTYAK